MLIGITERGDASLDDSWAEPLRDHKVDGAVLITKHVTDGFIEKVMPFANRVVVHATCTGYGGTRIEPNVPEYRVQLAQTAKLILAGFPASHCVLRIDPIIPTDWGLKRAFRVLSAFHASGLEEMGMHRVRISLIDEYRHVKERLERAGLPAAYEEFGPSAAQTQEAAEMLSNWPYRFEACAEPLLARKFPNCKAQGCISYEDLELMGIKADPGTLGENPQNRGGCHCLSCKKELLSNRHPCIHGCLYCYWKD